MMSDFVIEKHQFNNKDLLNIKTRYLEQYPVVYILYNNKKKPEAYIGETVQIERRMKDHLNNNKRKKLSDAVIIGHKQFNQSATYNIETNLINHFIGDEKYTIQNISQTGNVQMHAYFNKPFYNEELFEELWQYLYTNQLVDNTSDVIQNKDIYKLSPYTELSPEQLETKVHIIDYCKNNIGKNQKKVFTVEGEAGTGKSVVVSSLFNSLQDMQKDSTSNLYKTDNYLLVNHTEMIKTYESIAESLPNLTKNKILKPTTFINQMDKKDSIADVTIVDEAHLLLTQKDSYNNFNYENQLDEIIKRSKITVIIFDPMQVLKLKSYWEDSELDKIKEKYSADVLELTNQFRMLSSYEVNNWIDNFVAKQILPMPDKNKEFEFRFVEDAEELEKIIYDRNKKYGLSRIVSTFDYEHKKNGEMFLVDPGPGGLSMPWNTTEYSTSWAERPYTINEVGSIYTIQGFDLNYVGVVLGPSVDYDEEKDELVIDTDKYQDRGAFTGKKNMLGEEVEKAKEKIILNSINVLLKRGIHGLFIYAVNNKLRNKLLQIQEERDEKDGHY